MERSLYETRPQRPAIPRTVWALVCMDLSSELVHSRLPVFLVSTLGASALALGVIEGLVEATALVVKIFSGAISDYIGRSKGLLLLVYELTKLLFPLAHSVETVFTVRFLDCFVRRIRATLFAAGSHWHHRGAYSLSRRLKVRPPHLVISQGGFF